MRTIAFLIFDRFQLLDAAGPLAAFEMAMRQVRPAPYQLKVIARKRGLVVSSSTAGMRAESMNAAGEIDTLIVAGGEGTGQALICPRTVGFIRARAKSVRRVCSVCSGAYLLAMAGLLDGRRATTHWGQTSRFSKAFPGVGVEADRIYIRDGNIWTSAGVTAGIDLALALIADDLGEPVARRVAQELVVYYRRPSGQSQFSALLPAGSATERFNPLLGWIREHAAECLTVETLAQQCNMSARHFARVFRRETGNTPAKAVERVRLEVARERIESGRESLEAIACATGFSDPERMRRAFLRAFGLPPQALRRAARARREPRGGEGTTTQNPQPC